MSPLVKKEIRLLLPSFTFCCMLTLTNLFFRDNPDGSANNIWYLLAFIFCAAMIVMLALNSFGMEVGSGNFSSLLAQPVPRLKIWETKILLLAVSLLIVGILWCFFAIYRFAAIHHSFDLLDLFAGVVTFGLAVFSGGLWTVLLLRQVAAAFWFTVLVPGVMMVLVSALFDDDEFGTGMVVSVLGLYSLTGFFFARWLFLRAQDTAWTGGVINFSRWRYFESGAQSSVSLRRRRPIAAVLKKELRLHSISLLFACALLALHFGVFFLRAFYSNHHGNSVAGIVSDFFWILWLVVPVILGCTSVSEERKLGVAEAQFCQPVSRRAQFAIKFIPTMIFGTLLGGVMPILLETVGAHFGAPNEYFRPESHEGNGFAIPGIFSFEISIVALAAGLAWAGFFASTLTKNFLQALGAAIATVLGCILFIIFLVEVMGITFFSITPWHSILPFLIAIPTIPAALLWLAWLNFSHFHESWRLWRRNILGLAGAVIFVIMSSAVIYNRVWEVFEPAEPPHGPAKFTWSARPKLQNDFRGNFLVQLPDGRVWFDSLDSGFHGQFNWWNQMRSLLAPPLPKSAGPWQFIEGSNWVSTTASRLNWQDGNNARVTGYLDTVGIKDDGTLWISAESKPEVWTGAKMVRFGGEINWQEVVGSYNYFQLLKKDGTLWQWGTNSSGWWGQNQWQTNWPSVRAFQPRQIGTNSDWKEIFPADWLRCARKANGSFWIIKNNYKTGEDEPEHITNFDRITSQTLSLSGDGSDAYIGKDGTLWANMPDWEHGKKVNPGFHQIGKESNWVSVAVNRRWMIALKSDGSQWKWDIEWYNTEGHFQPRIVKTMPTRLGIHNDWVAIGNTWSGVVSLAADGSLWFWPGANYSELALLKCPKQPEFLGNVFGKAD